MWGKQSLLKSGIDDNKEWNLLGDFTQTGYSFCLSGILHPAVSSFHRAPKYLLVSRRWARSGIERDQGNWKGGGAGEANIFIMTVPSVNTLRASYVH